MPLRPASLGPLPAQFGGWARQRLELSREGVLLLALLALDVAMVSRAGYISYISVSCLGATVGLLLIARSRPTGAPPRWLWAATAAGLGLSMLLANFTDWPRGWPVLAFIAVALVGVTLAAAGRLRLGLAVAALAGLFYLSICWRWDPSQIDVLYGLRSAGHALLAGRDPYLALHPSTTLGDPRLLHFTYGPVVALLAALGLLAGDPRVISALAALGTAAALYRMAADRREASWLALTVCVSPLMVAMVISAWPLLLTTCGISWWLALRPLHRSYSILVLALTVGCGLVQIGPLLLVLFLRSTRLLLEILLAGIGGLALIAAFAAWTGFARYWYYTIGIHFHGVVGVGTLSLAGILTLMGKHPAPGFLGVSVGALALAWVVSRPTPGLGGALTDAATVTMFAMFFAKFAFINYYFVAFAAIWLAVAARGSQVAGDLAPVMQTWAPGARARPPAPEPAQPVANPSA